LAATSMAARGLCGVHRRLHYRRRCIN
jgi:hypothetical protein